VSRVTGKSIPITFKSAIASGSQIAFAARPLVAPYDAGARQLLLSKGLAAGGTIVPALATPGEALNNTIALCCAAAFARIEAAEVARPAGPRRAPGDGRERRAGRRGIGRLGGILG
jgi:hypothetical protein